MGKLTSLKSFPQFSVDFGDNSSSKTITESALFALDSLLYVMNLSLPIQAYPNALIAFSLHHTHPVCYKESNLIILSCDKNKWNQATYQLAHEICHLMISGEVVSELCWLEESICELSSYFFLPKITKYWLRLGRSNNIETTKQNYAPYFESYVIADQEKVEPFDLSLLISDPNASELNSLMNSHDLRKKNAYIAVKLLPIFKKYPKTWRAIPFLSKISSGLSLSDSLTKWIELSPIEAHTGLQKMAELFGASMPFPS